MGVFVDFFQVFLRTEPGILYPAMVVSHPCDRKKSQGWGTELRGTAITGPYGAGVEGGGLCWAHWLGALAIVSTNRPPAAISR